MTTYTILRHSDYANIDNIWDLARETSERKWRKLALELGISQKIESVIVVSSTAPRALQTAESLAQGLGISHANPVHQSEYLFDDLKHKWDIELALAFIQSLPDALFIVIVTHADFVIPLSKRLGFEGKISSKILDPIHGYPKYLEWITFQPSEQNEPKEDWLPESQELAWEAYSEFEFSLWGRRTIEVVRSIASLQAQKWTWQKIKDLDGTEYQFLVPEILPNVDPEDAMNGTCDREWYFAIKVKFDNDKSDLYHLWKQKDTPAITQLVALEWIFWELEDMAYPF